MQGFLVPGGRKGYQSLETLIVVQGIERYKTLSENSVRISSRQSVDKVQDLRCNLLREDCYLVVELGLADCKITDCELPIRLRKPNFCSIRPGSFMDIFATGEGKDGADGGNRSLISSKPKDLATLSFLLITQD